jgi:hypothetical protein
MAEVLANAPAIGLSEEELTQGAEVPKEVRQLAKGPIGGASQAAEDDEQLVAALGTAVDASNVREVGRGHRVRVCLRLRMRSGPVEDRQHHR